MDGDNNWLMTFDDLMKCPTVEGPSLELTEEETRELNKPRANGGIYDSDLEALLHRK